MVPIASSSPTVGPVGAWFGFVNRTLLGTTLFCRAGTGLGAQGRLRRPGTGSFHRGRPSASELRPPVVRALQVPAAA